jgi:hypothetical protein
MGIREQINRHQRTSIAVSACVVIMVVALISFENVGSGLPKQLNFYTTDDGATLFTDDWRKVPPFDHDGQQAVRAFVFSCDGGQHQFVQYLEKYSDAAKQQIEASQSRDQLQMGLIKKPNAKQWIAESDPRAAGIIKPQCPDGNSSGTYRQVFP